MPSPDNGTVAVAAIAARRHVRTVASGVSAAIVAHHREALVGIAVLQWLAILAFALTVRHNGWIFFQGGDQIWYATSGWLLAQGELPPTPTIGYGWSVVLAPVMLVTGPEFVHALPAVVTLNVLVLAPLAIAAIYGIGRHLASVAFGLWAAALWVALPFLSIPLWRSDYHERFVEQFLPQALGLTAMADYPSMVLLLVSAYLLVRSLETGDWRHAAASGLVAGFAVGMKPSNAIFLAAPVAALALARRPRAAVQFALALGPALIALAIWKQRGIGHLPLLSLDEVRVASGPVIAALGVDRYVEVDWGHLQTNADGLREYFWSARVLEWIPLAGVVAVARRSLPLAGLLGLWFTAFLVFKGASPRASVTTHSFFRFMMPAFPAYFLFAATIPLLVPTLLRRFAPVVPPPPRRLHTSGVVVLFALLGVAPILAVSLPPRLSDDGKALRVNEILVPVSDAIEVEIERAGEARLVSWDHPEMNGRVFYRVYRTAAGGADTDCSATTGAADCRLEMLQLGTTRSPRWRDGSPPPDALYRIGVATNWRDDDSLGDVFAISPPVESG